MTRMEELLLAWEENALDDAGREELKKLLDEPENRAELVKHLHTNEMIVTFFSEQDRSLRELSSDRPPFKVVPGFSRTFRQPMERQTGKLLSFPTWPLAAAACALLAAGMTLAVRSLLQEPAVATVGEVQGLVLARSPDGSQRIERKMVIRSGIELVGRGPKSGALLIYPDGSWVRIDGETAMTVTASQKGQRVHLSQGRLLARLQKQPPGRPFVFSTAQATATVLGTRLGLEIEQGATRLRVDEGRVRFTRLGDGRSIEVGGGNMAVARAGLPLRATPLVVASAELGTGAGKGEPVVYLGFEESRAQMASGRPRRQGELFLRRAEGAADAGLVEQLIAGKSGKALAADRFSTTVAHSGSLAPQRLTLSFWFRVTRSAPDIERPVLLDKEMPEQKSGFSLRGFEKRENQRSPDIDFGIWTDQGRKSLSCPVQEPELWNHVAITFDGDSLKMFCNGGLADSLATGAVELRHNRKDIILGRFIGLLDEVRLYDRALSQEEVEELAAE